MRFRKDSNAGSSAFLLRRKESSWRFKRCLSLLKQD
jgi:hypothetical protein